MKKLLILRGLPGSGKSRLTKMLVKFLVGCKKDAVICSADHYFKRGREYAFDPSKIGIAHSQCQVKALLAMSSEKRLVIIDNTNTQQWEYELYVQMGKAFGYEIEIKTVGGHSPEDAEEYFKRNIHNIPRDSILRMATRWEE